MKFVSLSKTHVFGVTFGSLHICGTGAGLIFALVLVCPRLFWILKPRSGDYNTTWRVLNRMAHIKGARNWPLLVEGAQWKGNCTNTFLFLLFPFSFHKWKYKPKEALKGQCTLKPSYKHIICFLLVFQNWTFVRKKLARALREERRAALWK